MNLLCGSTCEPKHKALIFPFLGVCLEIRTDLVFFSDVSTHFISKAKTSTHYESYCKSYKPYSDTAEEFDVSFQAVNRRVNQAIYRGEMALLRQTSFTDLMKFYL